MVSNKIMQSCTVRESVTFEILHCLPSEWQRRFTSYQCFDDTTTQVQHLFGYQLAQRCFWSYFWHWWVEKWWWKMLGMTFSFLCWYKPLFLTASPHATSTPNINSVRHADSRGSLISTDSSNSLPERNHDKGNSLDKVYARKYCKMPVQ